jgi:hypothetical protein
MSTDSPLLLKPWFHWTDEEKAHAVLEGYHRRVLTSSDIKESGYLRDIRLHNWTTWLFPLVAWPILKRTLWRYHSQSLLTQGPFHRFVALQIASIGISWAVWLNVNPYYKKV